MELVNELTSTAGNGIALVIFRHLVSSGSSLPDGVKSITYTLMSMSNAGYTTLYGFAKPDAFNILNDEQVHYTQVSDPRSAQYYNSMGKIAISTVFTPDQRRSIINAILLYCDEMTSPVYQNDFKVTALDKLVYTYDNIVLDSLTGIYDKNYKTKMTLTRFKKIFEQSLFMEYKYPDDRILSEIYTDENILSSARIGNLFMQHYTTTRIQDRRDSDTSESGAEAKMEEKLKYSDPFHSHPDNDDFYKDYFAFRPESIPTSRSTFYRLKDGEDDSFFYSDNSLVYFYRDLLRFKDAQKEYIDTKIHQLMEHDRLENKTGGTALFEYSVGWLNVKHPQVFNERDMHIANRNTQYYESDERNFKKLDSLMKPMFIDLLERIDDRVRITRDKRRQSGKYFNAILYQLSKLHIQSLTALMKYLVHRYDIFANIRDTYVDYFKKYTIARTGEKYYRERKNLERFQRRDRLSTTEESENDLQYNENSLYRLLDANKFAIKAAHESRNEAYRLRENQIYDTDEDMENTSSYSENEHIREDMFRDQNKLEPQDLTFNPLTPARPGSLDLPSIEDGMSKVVLKDVDGDGLTLDEMLNMEDEDVNVFS